jgi:BirA family transcriptional regulator, biotin operon repressor / biotin---[acetyl-CoA-carboxylase] ligase
MATDRLAAAVEALPLPWRGHFFEATDSTQDEARAAAQAGAPARSIFVADYQRAGRGRQGRSWLSEPGAGLLVSVVFRAEAPTPGPWRWTSLAAVSVAEAIERVVPPVRAAIKWPNDVLLNDRKVAGILAETSWNGQHLLGIVGIGINVNTDAAALEIVGAPATSLAVYGGRPIDRAELLLELVGNIDRWLERPSDELNAAWQSRLWGHGQRLRLVDLGREEDVVVLGAYQDGSLRVRMGDGSERRTTTGELIL